MKITLRNAVNGYADLLEIAKMKLPVKLSYAINRNIKKLEKEVRNFEDARIKILEELAEKDSAGKTLMADKIVKGKTQKEYILSAENREKFARDLNDLEASEIEIELMTVGMDIIDRIDEDARYNALTPDQIGGMEFMIKE